MRLAWVRFRQPEFQLAIGVLGGCFLVTLVLALLVDDADLPDILERML